MVKVTFTLDDRTVSRLRQAAARANKPQSQVVREAVNDYADRFGRLSEAKRQRAARFMADVDRELRSIRVARRSGGRRHRN